MSIFMRSAILAGLTLAVISLAFSCGGDHADDDHHSGGNTECQAVGSYCHDPGEIDAAAEECHQVMHEAEDGCEERLDECRAICKAVIDGAGGAGSGGAGTGGSGHEAEAGGGAGGGGAGGGGAGGGGAGGTG